MNKITNINPGQYTHLIILTQDILYTRLFLPNVIFLVCSNYTTWARIGSKYSTSSKTCVTSIVVEVSDLDRAYKQKKYKLREISLNMSETCL